MGSMQCNVEFGYQFSICSGTTENLDRVLTAVIMKSRVFWVVLQGQLYLFAFNAIRFEGT
jgi:hypothetical protein